jgi:YVTN family beta-propeller protein
MHGPESISVKGGSPSPVPASVALLAALFFVAGPVDSSASEPASQPGLDTARIRQPVALAFADGARLLLAANRRSGSLSVIDVKSSRVVAECDIGRGLADVATLPGGREVLVIDQAANEVVLLSIEGHSARVSGRLSVSPDPVRVLASADGATCVVASRWSRRLTVVELTRGEDERSLKAVRAIKLPFSPLHLAQVHESKLVVADAFGARLALVDAKRGAVDWVRSLPAHNIRALQPSPDGRALVLAHQVLHRQGRTTFEDVHWGSVISNHLRVLRTEALLEHGTDSDLLRGGRLIDLGDVGRAAGDPAGVALDERGDVVVALAGVGEVALGVPTGPAPSTAVRRTPVGRRPTAVALGPEGKSVYVADSFDDTVSVVELGTGERREVISLGPRPPLSAADRGERLFFDARLSHDGWMSCHSCHTDGHTNGLLNDTLGDGSFGAPKRVPSLLGVEATGPWTWLGAVDRLESQVRKSVETTMRGSSPTADQVDDLVAYLRSLAPPTPAETAAVAPESAAVERGRAVFRARECATCHAPPEYTSSGRYDVGLSDEVGNRKFNPPSLRGVSRREPLLHDGRARDLEDLFLGHRHPNRLAMPFEQVSDVVTFLKSL